MSKIKIPIDEEQTPDTLRRLIDRLREKENLDEEFLEKMSMDWRVEQTALQRTLQGLTTGKSWAPRAGELVLFVRKLAGSELCWDRDEKTFKLYDLKTSQFTNYPEWEAGVVSQVADETLSLRDILEESRKQMNVVSSGFRIEPLPHPNRKDKALTKQHIYVTMHQLRPFVFWTDFTKGTPSKQWHETIRNAVMVMSSVALVQKFHFKGQWPIADVLWRGVYIGSELCSIGDAVRLLPLEEDSDEVNDVLHITSIKMHLTNLDQANANDHDDGHPYNSTILLTGKGYTLDKSRSWNNFPAIPRLDVRQRLPPGMKGYEHWYPSHDPVKSYQVHFSRVLGRCFEYEPMLLWFPSSPFTNEEPMDESESDVLLSKIQLSHGLESVRRARSIATSHDERITLGKTWYWADSRGEQIGIHTMNGIDLSGHDRERDVEKLESWRQAMRIMERAGHSDDKARLQQSSTKTQDTTTEVLGGNVVVNLESSSGSGSVNQGEYLEVEPENDADMLDIERMRQDQRPMPMADSESESEIGNEKLIRQFGIGVSNPAPRPASKRSHIDSSQDAGSSSRSNDQSDSASSTSKKPKYDLMVE